MGPSQAFCDLPGICQTAVSRSQLLLLALLKLCRLNLLDLEAQEIRLPTEKSGIILTNPPYGERIGVRGNRNLEDEERATRFYQAFGTTLKQRFPGWTVFLFTADFNVPRLLRLKESRKTPFYNGPIECRLFRFDMVAGSNRTRKPVTFRIAHPAPSAGETQN